MPGKNPKVTSHEILADKDLSEETGRRANLPVPELKWFIKCFMSLRNTHRAPRSTGGCRTMLPTALFFLQKCIFTVAKGCGIAFVALDHGY